MTENDTKQSDKYERLEKSIHKYGFIRLTWNKTRKNLSGGRHRLKTLEMMHITDAEVVGK